MGFGVAIGKREVSRIIMIGTRQVAPFVIVETVDKESVIDGVAVLVQKNKNGGGIVNIRRSKKLHVVRVEGVGQHARITNHGIHGHAPNARSICRRGLIRWTFVNSSRFAGKGAEFGLGKIKVIGVIIAIAPILHVVCPGLSFGCRFRFALIVHQAIFIVISVQKPGDGQLFDIVQASDSLRLHFRLAQGRQQKRRQNGDDGDDDQKFDEGEASRRFGTDIP